MKAEEEELEIQLERAQVQLARETARANELHDLVARVAAEGHAVMRERDHYKEQARLARAQADSLIGLLADRQRLHEEHQGPGSPGEAHEEERRPPMRQKTVKFRVTGDIEDEDALVQALDAATGEIIPLQAYGAWLRGLAGALNNRARQVDEP